MKKKSNKKVAVALESADVEVLPPEEPTVNSHEPVAPILELEGVEVLPSEVTDEPVEVEVEIPELKVPRPAPVTKEIGRYDPLQAYLREIANYPALSREEEKALAIRYHNADDLEAAYKLVSSNLWLAVKIARDYEKAARSVLDLIQEGNIGLMEAVKNFDPYRGVRFPSYAVWWIKAYIIRYVIANWRLVKIGTTQAQRKLFFSLKKEKDKLEREGFYPEPKLLAEKLEVKESDIIEMEQRLGSADLSVDAPFNADSDSNLLSVLPNNSLSAEEILSKKEVSGLISSSFDEFATTLNAKERIIFEKRLLNEDKNTLQELSDELKLSRERVRQIENRVKDKLKAFLLDRFGENFSSLDFVISD